MVPCLRLLTCTRAASRTDSGRSATGCTVVLVVSLLSCEQGAKAGGVRIPDKGARGKGDLQHVAGTHGAHAPGDGTAETGLQGSSWA